MEKCCSPRWPNLWIVSWNSQSALVFQAVTVIRIPPRSCPPQSCSVVDYGQDTEEGLPWGECSEAQAGVAPGRAWGPRGVGEGNPRVSAVGLGVSPKPPSDFALP